MLKKLWNIFTTLLVVLVLLVAASLVAIRIFGAGAYAVLSGSMEPTYPVGSMIYVAKAPYTELRVGDPVTFAFSEDLAVTHRIVAITPDEKDASLLWFTTKGDANEQADANPLDCRNVIGRPLFAVPYLGYALQYVQEPPGRYVALGILGVLLLLSLLPSLLSPDKKSESESEKERAVAPVQAKEPSRQDTEEQTPRAADDADALQEPPQGGDDLSV